MGTRVLEAFERAGADGAVRKVQAYGPDMREMPGVFGIEGADGRPLHGVAVGSRYTVLTNRALADIADRAADAIGIQGPPAVTTWHGGARVSVLLPVTEFGVGIGEADRTAVRLRVDNVHGHGGVIVAVDMLRRVCSNGMVRRVGGARSIISHSLSVEKRVESVVQAAARAQGIILREEVTARALADRALSQDELRRFFLAVHESAYGPLADEGTRARQTAIERVASWVRNLDHAHQAVAGIQGTAWAALQSVTQWADHEAPSRDRRTSADHGALAGVKRAARAVAESILVGVRLGE